MSPQLVMFGGPSKREEPKKKSAEVIEFKKPKHPFTVIDGGKNVH